MYQNELIFLSNNQFLPLHSPRHVTASPVERKLHICFLPCCILTSEKSFYHQWALSEYFWINERTKSITLHLYHNHWILGILFPTCFSFLRSVLSTVNLRSSHYFLWEVCVNNLPTAGCFISWVVIEMPFLCLELITMVSWDKVLDFSLESKLSTTRRGPSFGIIFCHSLT